MLGAFSDSRSVYPERCREEVDGVIEALEQLSDPAQQKKCSKLIRDLGFFLKGKNPPDKLSRPLPSDTYNQMGDILEDLELLPQTETFSFLMAMGMRVLPITIKMVNLSRIGGPLAILMASSAYLMQLL